MNNTVIGIIGTKLDHKGLGNRRWKRWRPSVSIFLQDNFQVDHFIILHHKNEEALVKLTTADMQTLSPQTRISHYMVDYDDPWDFEQVYAQLHDLMRQHQFTPEETNYYVHMTTGTHVAQICLYLLTEANYIPGKLLQTAPAARNDVENRAKGSYQIIDLDLSCYDQIASRFEREARDGISYLKGGIETRNKQFNQLIQQLEQVSIRSTEPILLTGHTGVGKSRLAKRIYQLKKQRGLVKNQLVEVNCATLRGDNAMSTLFGHIKGAYTGAVNHRKGLLREADQGVLFLDEIGELGTDEQAMLLRAIEDKIFMPLGSDKEVSSNFQLIAGTNRNLFKQVRKGTFREDLLARINLWHYQLPSLKERIEDLEPNIQHELELFTGKAGYKVDFNKGAKAKYLAFSYSEQALWKANFRDLNASITRMATLAKGGRITEEVVDYEIKRLQYDWQGHDLSAKKPNKKTQLEQVLDKEIVNEIDLFEQIQLCEVIHVCQHSKSLAEAGRKLFNVSREKRKSSNDSHRLRTYLAKYGLVFKKL